MLLDPPNEKIYKMVQSLYPDLKDKEVYELTIAFEQLGSLLVKIWIKKNTAK